MNFPPLRQVFVGAGTVALLVGLTVSTASAQDQGTSSENGSAIGSLLNSLVGQPSEPETSEGVIRGRCESRNNNRAYCEVDTSAGVRLVRQLSQTTCTDNWGFDAGGIWVDKGCRAEFEVGVPVAQPTATPAEVSGLGGTVVVCESLDGKRAFCSVDTSRGVELARSLAGSSCTDRWGYDDDGIWVDRGCRAEFLLPGLPPTPTPVASGAPSTLVCQSKVGQRAYCAADTSSGVRLRRQLNDTNCVGNWGYDSGGVWVTGGCWAEFEVASPEAAEPTAVTKKEVTCRSRSGARQYCRAVVTKSIRLVREISSGKCVGNWGFDENRIWVDDDCHAVFVVK